MRKNRLLLIPFLAGLLLIISSWYLSYPLSHHSSNDTIFSHVSILYWIGFPLLLTSMYMMGLNFKNKYCKWMMCIGCVIILYSLSYFFNTLPTSDANYFRAVTENFINRDPNVFSRYYQWPAFFVLADVISSVSGLQLITFEFLFFTIIGFLLSTTL